MRLETKSGTGRIFFGDKIMEGKKINLQDIASYQIFN